MKTDIIKIIERGKVGWHCEGLSKDGNRWSSSGGNLEGYCKDAPDDTPVVDALNADDAAFTAHVLRGPMLDCALKPSEVSKFGEGERRTLAMMLPGLGGSFKAIGVMGLSGFSSLDSIALDIHLALKRQIPGMKFGVVQDGKVVWEAGPIA